MTDVTRPKQHLIDDVAKDIHALFDVSQQEAAGYAIGILGLMESQMVDISRTDPPTAFAHFVGVHGDRLAWRSASKKQEWLSHKKAGAAGYNSFLDSARSSPFKKW